MDTAPDSRITRSVAGTFDRVLVVSHAAGVRDAFETVIAIETDEDGVSWVGAPASTEAVKA